LYDTSTGDLVGPPVLSVTASETDQSTDSTTFSGNDVTGYSSTSSDASSNTSGSKYSWTTVDTSETANSLTGSFSLTETTNASFSNYETDSNSGLSTEQHGPPLGQQHQRRLYALGNEQQQHHRDRERHGRLGHDQRHHLRQ
jgi:hypothetical protein